MNGVAPRDGVAPEVAGAGSWRANAFALGAVAARWLLGGLFVYTGLEKAADPVAFLKLVRQYDLVQSAYLLNAIAGALPWFEVFCGLLLVTGVAVRGAAAAAAGVLIPFTAVVWHRALVLQSGQRHPLLRREIQLRLRHRRGLYLRQAAGEFRSRSAGRLAHCRVRPEMVLALLLIPPAAGK